MKEGKEETEAQNTNEFLGNLRSKLPPQTTITFMLASVIFIWFLDSVINLMVRPDRSLSEIFFKVSVHEIYTRMLLSMAIWVLLLLVVKYKVIKFQSSQFKDVFNNVIPICITNLNYEIVKANDSYWSDWGKKGYGTIKCYDSRPGKYCHTDKCALTQILNGAEEYICESQKTNNGKNQYFIITARPLLDSNKKIIGIIESFQDITARKKLEDEKKYLLNEIQKSLEKVKLLSGIIPICASCKKIRDDKGFWEQVESYVRNHSEAEFSHCICPQCVETLYPELELSTKKLEKSPQNICAPTQ